MIQLLLTLHEVIDMIFVRGAYTVNKAAAIAEAIESHGGRVISITYVGSKEDLPLAVFSSVHPSSPKEIDETIKKLTGDYT